MSTAILPATYTNDPAGRDIDKVRFLARDHVEGRMLVSDSEIEWLLSTEANAYMAAAMVCEQMAERTLRSKTVGDMTLTFNVRDLQSRAQELRSRGGFAGAVPTAASAAAGTERYFRLGMHNHPSVEDAESDPS